MQAIKQGFSRRDLKAARKRRVAAQPELFREPSPGFHCTNFTLTSISGTSNGGNNLGFGK
jgi:hypothetical protein